MKSFTKLFESMLTKPAMPTWGVEDDLVTSARRLATVPVGAPRTEGFGPVGGWSW